MSYLNIYSQKDRFRWIKILRKPSIDGKEVGAWGMSRAAFRTDGREEGGMRGKGSYILILHLDSEKVLQVGRLGKFNFPAGYYAYVGSAFGPGGLKARVTRHLNPTYKYHWHIDYLRKQADPEEVWISEQKVAREHLWASVLLHLNKAAVPVPGFGCSDCKCCTHLFHFQKKPLLRTFKKLMQIKFPSDEKIRKME